VYTNILTYFGGFVNDFHPTFRNFAAFSFNFSDNIVKMHEFDVLGNAAAMRTASVFIGMNTVIGGKANQRGML